MLKNNICKKCGKEARLQGFETLYDIPTRGVTPRYFFKCDKGHQFTTTNI